MHRRNRFAFLVGAGLLGAITPAMAADMQNLDIKGKVWARFGYEATENSNHSSGFDLYRTYLQASYKFDQTWSTTLLLDGFNNGNKYSVFVRNAYVQAGNIWEGNGTMRFGLMPTLYTSTIEGATKTRWLAKSLADEIGALQTYGAGVAFTGDVQNFLNYGLNIHNGSEGANLTGTGSNLDSAWAIGIKATLMPFANEDGALRKLGVTLYDEFENNGHTRVSNTNANTVTTGANTIAAALHFEHMYFDGAFEYLNQNPNGDERAGAVNTKTIAAYGLTANIKFMDEKFSIFGRWYSGNDALKLGTGFRNFDNNTPIGNPTGALTNINYKTIVAFGPTWSFIKDKLATALIYETRAINSDTSSAGAKDYKAITWNWAANF